MKSQMSGDGKMFSAEIPIAFRRESDASRIHLCQRGTRCFADTASTYHYETTFDLVPQVCHSNKYLILSYNIFMIIW